MRVVQVNDWCLEDRLSADPRPIVVLFLKSGEPKQDTPRREFRQTASAYSQVRFYEIDLLEHPSAAVKHSISTFPMTSVFVAGVEVARHLGSFLVGTLERILGPEPGPFEDD